MCCMLLTEALTRYLDLKLVLDKLASVSSDACHVCAATFVIINARGVGTL